VTSIKFWSYESLMLKFFVISAVISHRRKKIQQTSSFLFNIMNALLKISCKEYVHYKWSINRVKEKLNIDESEYMQLKMRIWNQMKSLQLIKWKLNINKLKETLRSTFEVIYHEFHIIFQRCHKIKKWFYVNVHDTAIKLQCKKMIQSQRDMMKQS